MARWTPGPVAPGAEQASPGTGRWTGRPPPGRYVFRVAVTPVASAAREVVDSFRFLDHKFPVRGPHDFGAAGARSVRRARATPTRARTSPPRCGTPLVAARGGTVVFKAWQERAGNYVVIRGAGNGVDYVYMHLATPTRSPAGRRSGPAARSARSATRASPRGCHLHFELWSAPGWYEGGSPLDPLPQLQAWDAVS